jgi:hypothetical protein
MHHFLYYKSGKQHTKTLASKNILCYIMNVAIAEVQGGVAHG